MHIFVAVTDNNWFALLAPKAEVEEVNFWCPSSDATFRALQPGELLLFKLHAPDNYIAGGEFFARFLRLPLNLAWDAFGEANGVRSIREMRDRIAHYRRIAIAPHGNPTVGCIMLAEPFFWDRSDWIPTPAEFKHGTQVGKGFDSDAGPGQALWEAVRERLMGSPADRLEHGTATEAVLQSGGLGRAQIVYPRLGQGLFRILVTNAYSRRCAITAERTLPVLMTRRAPSTQLSVC